MAKDAKEKEQDELALLEATIARLRELGGHFPLSDETAEVIWRTTSPTPTSAKLQARLAELLGDVRPSETDALGSTLRRWREAAQLSVTQLARSVGVADQVVAGLEAGEHPATRPPDFWEKLAGALAVQPVALAQLLRGSLAMPLPRRGMTAARSDEIDMRARREWLQVSDEELDQRMRERLEETIRRLERA